MISLCLLISLTIFSIQLTFSVRSVDVIWARIILDYFFFLWSSSMEQLCTEICPHNDIAHSTIADNFRSTIPRVHGIEQVPRQRSTLDATHQNPRPPKSVELFGNRTKSNSLKKVWAIESKRTQSRSFDWVRLVRSSSITFDFRLPRMAWWLKNNGRIAFDWKWGTVWYAING